MMYGNISEIVQCRHTLKNETIYPAHHPLALVFRIVNIPNWEMVEEKSELIYVGFWAAECRMVVDM